MGLLGLTLVNGPRMCVRKPEEPLTESRHRTPSSPHLMSPCLLSDGLIIWKLRSRAW